MSDVMKMFAKKCAEVNINSLEANYTIGSYVMPIYRVVLDNEYASVDAYRLEVYDKVDDDFFALLTTTDAVRLRQKLFGIKIMSDEVMYNIAW